MPLETEATAQIRALLDGLKPNDADLLEALHRVQHRYGYVSPEAMRVVGEQLGLATAHVYGATTYYADFRTTPPPATTIAWCAGAACRLKRSDGILRAMEAVLGIRLAEPDPDHRVEILRGQCNGTCELAPMAWINERAVAHMTPAKAIEFARALASGASTEEALKVFDASSEGNA
ncbi:MAG: NAD(P)H-dependent oxidoreductase subunit E [Dehalococcoidia bacterium]